MKIKVVTNGPLIVLGPCELVDHDGAAFAPPNAARFALCRCGGSSNRPFCDGTHARSGFFCIRRDAESDAVASPRSGDAWNERSTERWSEPQGPAGITNDVPTMNARPALTRART